MAENGGRGEELERWRSRYYDQIQHLDEKEREWAQTEKVLRRCASRLAAAMDPQDPALASELKRLRQALNNHETAEQLESRVKAFADGMMRSGGSDAEPATSAPQALLALLDGLEVPPGFEKRSDNLRRRLAEAAPTTPLAPLVDDLSDLIRQALQGAKGETAGARRKGLRGLFGRDDGRGEEGGTQEAAAPLRHLLQRLREGLGLAQSAALLERRLANAPDAAALHAVADELAMLLVERLGEAGETPSADLAGGEPIAVNDLLIRLLERLQIPADLADEVAAMKRSLEAGLPPESVEPTLTAIAELMARVRTSAQKEKQEIEGFLKELTGHLRMLDEVFRERENVRQESLEHGRHLDQAVTEQVRGLESSVAHSDDLDALRRTIQQSMTTIRHHMDSFRRTEEERARKAEEEAERLAQRLGEVEREADNLRDRILTERRQAFFDPLTGIYNRLAYDQRIEQEYARWKRYGSPLTMMIWDVDRFKDVNDTYGHQAGDKVLRVIAKLMTRRVRETDFVARYGGEEFVTLLSETDLAQAWPVAEKLRQGIAEADFHYRGDRVPITVSCGIAQFGEGDDADSVFRRADAALYRAKDEGRNCCRSEEPDD